MGSVCLSVCLSVHAQWESWVEFVLGLGNNLVKRNTFEYYFGDLIQNSKLEKK